MENVIVRPATVDDALGIATVHVKTWKCAYRGHMPDSYLDDLSIEKRTVRWKDQLQHPLNGAHTFVAEVNREVVGWCTAGQSRDDDVAKETGELYGIYIDPSYIGKGIGTKLMNKALEELKNDGFKKATLWVLTTNDNSRKFYEKKQWKIEGKTKTDNRDNFELHETRYITDLS